MVPVVLAPCRLFEVAKRGGLERSPHKTFFVAMFKMMMLTRLIVVSSQCTQIYRTPETNVLCPLYLHERSFEEEGAQFVL